MSKGIKELAQMTKLMGIDDISMQCYIVLTYNRHDLVYFCQLYDDNVLGLCNLHIQTRLFGGKKLIKRFVWI